jgi:predicted  nucleic acid-binding Zn-ribbon protein
MAMASTVPATLPSQAERLEERIRAHKEEVARLRERIGDPEEALSRFVTEHFEVQALVPDERSGQARGTALWDDEDDLDAG